MAQRGGTVLSHLKVGSFSSPLIRPGCADCLILLKSENRLQHGAFLRPSGWTVVNASATEDGAAAVDADRLALTLNNPKAVNLIVMGYALKTIPDFFCNGEDIKTLLKARLADRPDLRSASLEALETGERQAEAVRHKA
jgi:indolepyruvate ferredoxin oxidoreductase beta subunit